MPSGNTLLLKGEDVTSLLSLGECMNAVEEAFRLDAEGKAMPPKVMGLPLHKGGFHVKAGILNLKRPYFVAKVNANFPGNLKQYNLPTIQGVIVVCDAENGRLLSLIDSGETTIIRTGAATGVATKYLANANATVATICGCGNQGRISLKALMKVRKLKKVFAFDVEKTQAEKLKKELGTEVGIVTINSNDLPKAVSESQIIITCTPSKQPFIRASYVMPGSFIAAVGSDNEDKQELLADLVASNKVVADIAEQSATIGEVHHAIEQSLMNVEDIYAGLGDVIAGKKVGRETEEEIIIFDSTGTALQDVAAAAIIYEKAIKNGIGINFNFTAKEIEVI